MSARLTITVVVDDEDDLEALEDAVDQALENGALQRAIYDQEDA